MASTCTSFIIPTSFRQFPLISSFCSVSWTNGRSKFARPRSWHTATESSRPRKTGDVEFQRGTWEARRYQHGGPTPTHSSPIRPKQSLGQNFLRDKSVVAKIVSAFDQSFDRLSPSGSVIEIGAGTGALSSALLRSHSGMLAVEIDVRAVEFLREAYPDLEVLHDDVLSLDWSALADKRGKPLAVVGNLPYNIVSQILFTMLEARAGALSFAVVMMQREVAERICASTRTKAYGILSVVCQLYSRPALLFDVPNTAFYPKPNVTSTMVQFEFVPHPCLDVTDTALTSALRTVLRAAFQQRRKTLRNSLRKICEELQVELDDEWSSKRPEEISPERFVELTELLYAKRLPEIRRSRNLASDEAAPVWRARKR